LTNFIATLCKSKRTKQWKQKGNKIKVKETMGDEKKTKGTIGNEKGAKKNYSK
jgi:hypothetical protein